MKYHEERVAARKAKELLRASEEETVLLREVTKIAVSMIPQLDELHRRLGLNIVGYPELRCALLAVALTGPL